MINVVSSTALASTTRTSAEADATGALGIARWEQMLPLKLKWATAPPDSIRARLGGVSDRSTPVLKSVKTEQ
jgi:hypothetical protein